MKNRAPSVPFLHRGVVRRFRWLAARLVLWRWRRGPEPGPILAAAVAGLLISACRAPRATGEREQVLFVCEHGAAKSVIAATYFNALAKARGLAVRATARGADPQGMPSASTVEGLARDGLTPVVDRPIRLEPGDLRASGHVVAFDCGVPAVSAMRATAVCWDDVPTVSDDYPRARDAIHAHVAALVDEAARAGARPPPAP